MDIPLDLAATFAELRGNHFHGGLDMRTEQVIGKQLFSVEEGYVSRISVSGSGYGNCLYINHPCGITSVYAHMDGFSERIDSLLLARQYEAGRFDIDFELQPSELPVERGELIGLSGNSGGSTGPHLHFEFRKTGTDYMIDPQDYYKIDDNVKPRFHGFAVAPKPGTGVVDGSADTRFYRAINISSGSYRGSRDSIKAWGVVGVEVSANDYMPYTHFKFGLRRVEMKVDGKTCFAYFNDHYYMDSTRLINSFIDYARWQSKRDMYMRMFLLPNAHKGLFHSVENGGYLSINEQRPYQIEITASDYAGNASTLRFTIYGDSTSIPVVSAYNGGEYFPWNYYNAYKDSALEIELKPNSLYDDFYFTCSAEADSAAHSDAHRIGDESVPLENAMNVKIRLNRDELDDKQKYYPAKRNRAGSGYYGCGIGTYEDGWLSFRSSSFGTFKIMCDTVPPAIYSPRKIDGGVSFKIADRQSGIKRFEGKVDGKFAVFYYDAKNDLCFCKFDDKRVLRGGYHVAELTVEDNCGNVARKQATVWW